MYIATGKDLRKIRIEYGMKQKEMAKCFKISRGTYSCWESRYKDLPLPRKKHLSEFLAIEFSYEAKKRNEDFAKEEQSSLLCGLKKIWNKIRRR